MKIKQLIEEDFVNYKKPSMFIATAQCDWKCCKEQNLDTSICQNSALAQQPTIEVSIVSLIDRYLSNPITSAVVFGGLEPIFQTQDIVTFINDLRAHDCMDVVVIFTGYYEFEIEYPILQLSKYENVVVKFGRYIPSLPKQFDIELGIVLASSNQYARKLKFVRK